MTRAASELRAAVFELLLDARERARSLCELADSLAAEVEGCHDLQRFVESAVHRLDDAGEHVLSSALAAATDPEPEERRAEVSADVLASGLEAALPWLEEHSPAAHRALGALVAGARELMRFRCEKCGALVALERSPAGGAPVACPFHPGATYWLEPEQT